MKRRVLLMLCMVSCLTVLLAGCSLTKENPNLKESKLVKKTESYVKEDYWATNANYEQIVTQIDTYYGGVEGLKDTMPEEQYEYYVNICNDYKEYQKMVKKYKGFKKKVKSEFSLASTSASVAVTAITKNGKKVVFTATYDKNGEMTDFKAEDYKSVGQIMGKAGLNTVMSMAIVFCVLIFISLLISCFKFIPNGSNKKTEEVVAEAPAAVVEENLTDDLELVAVITAAIAAASETESADGLVVRSIVRRS